MAELAKQLIDLHDAKDEFEACRRVVDKHFGDGNRRQPAGDLEELARSKGISVRRRVDAPFEGMIEREGDGSATITLQSTLNRRRERFTLAHELGHWMLQEETLGSLDGKLFRGISVNNEQMAGEEGLASLLAAEMLMPYQPLLEAFDDARKLESLHHICRKFTVSRTAAIRRLADVCQRNFILLQIVPFRFRHFETAAEIDDAIFASSRRGTLFARGQTKFIEPLTFRDVIAEPTVTLHLDSPKGRMREDFETIFRPDPIPHAFAFTSVVAWPVRNDHRAGQTSASRNESHSPRENQDERASQTLRRPQIEQSGKQTNGDY